MIFFFKNKNYENWLKNKNLDKTLTNDRRVNDTH